MNTQNGQSIFDIDFRDLGGLLLRSLWILILCFSLCFGYIYYTKETVKVPLYTASATMYVSNSNDVKYIYSTSDTYNAQKLIETCSVVIKTNKVIDKVVEQLDGKYKASEIRGSINVSSVQETEVMQITCTTDDPNKSAEVCNAILVVVPDILKENIKVGAAEILDEAQVPTAKTNLPSFKQPFVYGVAAAVIAAVIIVVAYLLDTRIKSKEEITAQYGIPVLSDIPNFNVKAKERYRTYYEHK
ncbi:MAG: hypothetical protein E7660_03010 [Ruminococcaceae bacterium]|nr:hypothetical protein [Oscillospiraceae bacterium]